MTLANPWLLLLLPIVPFMMWMRYGRRRRSWRVPFSNTQTFSSLPSTWRVQLRWIPAVLFAIAGILIIVGLSGPRRGLTTSTVRKEVVDIALVVDVSTSMQALDLSDKDTERTRLDAAKEVLVEFIKAREHDRMSIVAFSGVPYTLAPLTLDRAFLQMQLDRLEIGMLKQNGTAVGSAIGTAVARLSESEASGKAIILLTDGVSNAGLYTPEEAAELAKAQDIRIYAIGAGSSDGRTTVRDRFGRLRQVQMDPIDEESLKNIAATTGGLYFKAENFDALNKVYETIDSMEKTVIEEDDFVIFEDKSLWVILPAMAVLLLEMLLGGFVFRRLTA